MNHDGLHEPLCECAACRAPIEAGLFCEKCRKVPHLSLAAHALFRDRDYYPADSLDKESCFFNGQIGRCGINCLCFLNSNCPEESEVLNAAGASSLEDL